MARRKYSAVPFVFPEGVARLRLPENFSALLELDDSSDSSPDSSP